MIDLSQEPVFNSSTNVFLDPGYDPAWSYQHLYALSYICGTITFYCLRPKDVFRTGGSRLLRLARTLLDSGALRVVAKETHFEALEDQDLSDIPRLGDRHEIKAFSKNLIESSTHLFEDIAQARVRYFPNDINIPAETFVIKAMQSKPNLKKFYKKEVENNKEQLPTWLQPNKHPRQGILPQILSEMPDEKLRFFHLPYAFFCDLLAMHAVDSHALIYRHPKWNEWYYNVWKDFYLKMSPEYEPEQVLSIKRATIPTISLPSQLIPALADVVKIVTLDNRLVEPEKFRKGEGFRIIQNEIVPILLNSTSSFVSDADAKNVLRDIVEGQKVKLKSLMDNMGLLENSPESKVSTVLKTLLPEELLEVMGLVCPIAGLLDIAKTSYFRWLHWKDSRKIRELRTAAKKNGVWFGLMVNEEGLLKYRDLWKMIP